MPTNGAKILKTGGKKMNCLICKSGKMIESYEAYFAKLDTGYIIIENVPCYKCDQCGEILYSMSTVEKIEEMIKNYKKVSSKIFIVDYKNAA